MCVLCNSYIFDLDLSGWFLRATIPRGRVWLVTVTYGLRHASGASYRGTTRMKSSSQPGIRYNDARWRIQRWHRPFFSTYFDPLYYLPALAFVPLFYLLSGSHLRSSGPSLFVLHPCWSYVVKSWITLMVLRELNHLLCIRRHFCEAEAKSRPDSTRVWLSRG